MPCNSSLDLGLDSVSGWSVVVKIFISPYNGSNKQQRNLTEMIKSTVYSKRQYNNSNFLVRMAIKSLGNLKTKLFLQYATFCRHCHAPLSN